MWMWRFSSGPSYSQEKSNRYPLSKGKKWAVDPGGCCEERKLSLLLLGIESNFLFHLALTPSPYGNSILAYYKCSKLYLTFIRLKRRRRRRRRRWWRRRRRRRRRRGRGKKRRRRGELLRSIKFIIERKEHLPSWKFWNYFDWFYWWYGWNKVEILELKKMIG